MRSAVSRLHRALRAESPRLLRLALPLAVSQLGIIGMGVTDVIVAGHAGRDDLAAVTIGFYAWDMALLLIFGVMLANGALIGHRHGAGDEAGLRRQFQQSLWLALPLAVVSALAIVALRALMPVLQLPAEVITIASGYLTPTIGTAALLPLVILFRTTAEGMGLARSVMWLNTGAFLLNIPLDIAFVLGAFGQPGMGGAGCGWATLIAFATLLLAWLACSFALPALRRQRLWHAFAPPSARDIGHTLSIGLPIGLSLLGVGGFFAVLPMLMASLGAVAIAGHAIAITVDTLMLTVPLGLGQAMTVRVAHELGAGNPHGARAVCVAGMTLSAALALLQALPTVIWRTPLAALFTSDPEVAALGALLLLYAAAYRLFDSVQVAAGMALRGYKDTRVASAINIAAYWLFGLPLCWLLAMGSPWHPGLGVTGFWTGMLTSIALAASAIAWRLARTSRRATGAASGSTGPAAPRTVEA